ncbi:hypothetical protein [Ruminococcus sp. NK3A76]|uniref:hypothetical protein n=1 Tax=Ruminococcus sp. NK3A76 TaxID=877411 RepID=UPI00048AC25C|nr:hypothetical protein [Ruminococcus sp. NK3A76]
MARKNESTSEKIVRLYKEGCSVDEIARVMEIPKGNIPNILEKHFPDYQNYVQPERKHDIEPEKPAKKGGIGGFFGRGKKEEPAADASSSMLNLDMDDEGFIDRSVAGIASMIKKGRSPKDICAFLNCTPADVAAVSVVMDEHFRRKEAAETAKKESFKTGPDYDGPKVKESTDLLTGNSASDAVSSAPVSVADLEQEYVPPVYDPVPENPTMDELTVPDVNDLVFESDIPKTPATAHETEEEVEKSIEERSADNFEIPSASLPEISDLGAPVAEMADAPEAAEAEAQAEETAEAQPEETAEPEAPAFTSSFTSPFAASTSEVEDSEEDTTDYNIEEDDSMTPMEKMRKFAELQIKDNEDKIAELEKKAEDAKASVDSVAARVGEIEAQIAKLREEADQIASEKVKAEAEAADIESQIAALQKENDEFKSYIK